jgi:hypothetical protein
MPDRDDPNSPHATTPNINGRVARLEIDVATLRSGQDFSTRLLDERFKTFEAQMVGHQKSLDAIQALIETSRVNPEGSPIVRQYLEWRATVETRLVEFQTRADRQDGVVTGLKFLGVGGLLTALATLAALVVRIVTMPGPVV